LPTEEKPNSLNAVDEPTFADSFLEGLALEPMDSGAEDNGDCCYADIQEASKAGGHDQVKR
jgi:hypothetical protein